MPPEKSLSPFLSLFEAPHEGGEPSGGPPSPYGRGGLKKARATGRRQLMLGWTGLGLPVVTVSQ